MTLTVTIGALNETQKAFVSARPIPEPACGFGRTRLSRGATACAAGGSGCGSHFLGTMDQASGTVLAKFRVDAAINEIAMFKARLDHLPLTGAVITAHAPHTWVGHAHYR